MAKRTKNEMRASIFSDEKKKPASLPFTFFGEQMEVRQPTLLQIHKMGKYAASDKPGIARAIIEYCYIPGSDEKVFEETDLDQIASLPTGQWLHDFNEVIEKLTGTTDVKAAEKNSDATA